MVLQSVYRGGIYGTHHVASFATRREADLAIEHLVQQYGIERTDVFVRAPGEANGAGTRGADVGSGQPGVKKDGRPEPAGPAEVSVDCHGGKTARIETAFREVGALKLKAQ